MVQTNFIGGRGHQISGTHSAILGGYGNNDNGFAYVGMYGQNLNAVAANTFHVEQLNAINTQAYPGGTPYPSGTIFRLAPGGPIPSAAYAQPLYIVL
jgi:hypothetical protein